MYCFLQLPLQTNNADCGLYVCLYAVLLTKIIPCSTKVHGLSLVYSMNYIILTYIAYTKSTAEAIDIENLNAADQSCKLYLLSCMLRSYNFYLKHFRFPRKTRSHFWITLKVCHFIKTVLNHAYTYIYVCSTASTRSKGKLAFDLPGTYVK